ncbi:hypothetical protein ACE6JH_35615 [Streptomyces nigra]
MRPESGRYLDGWYKRLRDAYIATMADLGVGEKLSPQEFLEAMDGYKSHDPELGIVVDAIKMTVKGRHRQAAGEDTRWRLEAGTGLARPLPRPTRRPDIRATVISRARINMHRKMVALAAATGQYPVAVLSDCAVYAADGPSPLDVLPYDDGKTVPGSFRLGVSPGMVKHEGTQSVLWGANVLEKLAGDGHVANLARYIKTGEVTAKDTGE